MNELLCYMDDKYVPIDFFGEEKGIPEYWSAMETAKIIVKDKNLKAALNLKDDFAEKCIEVIDTVLYLRKNRQLMDIGVGRPDFTKCIIKTELSGEQIKTNLAKIMEASHVLKKLFKKIEERAMNDENFIVAVNKEQKDKLSPDFFRADGIPDFADYRTKKYPVPDFLRDCLSMPYFISGETNARLILSGAMQFKNNDIDNYQTKTYVVCDSEGKGYLDKGGAVTSLSKARTYSTAKNAQQVCNMYRSKYHVVEMLMSFNGITAGQKPPLKELALMEARAEKDKIKQVLSSEKIETMQFEALAFKKHCLENGLDYKTILEKISQQLLSKSPKEEGLSTKEKSAILTQELEVLAPVNKPKTKTL